MAEPIGTADKSRFYFNSELNLNHDFLMVVEIDKNILVGSVEPILHSHHLEFLRVTLAQ